MTETLPATAYAPVSAELYAQILQLYVRQLSSLDAGLVDRWVDVFTEDAVFEEIHRGEPLRGREAIRTRAHARAAGFAAQGLAFRHWINMLRVVPEQTDAGGAPTRLRTLLYAMAMATPRGGRLEIKASVVCRDLLVLVDGRWRVRHRDLRHDGTPHAYRGPGTSVPVADAVASDTGAVTAAPDNASQGAGTGATV